MQSLLLNTEDLNKVSHGYLSSQMRDFKIICEQASLFFCTDNKFKYIEYLFCVARTSQMLITDGIEIRG